MGSRALPRGYILLFPIWLALLVRVMGLADQSLWYDEGYTAMFARQDMPTIVMDTARLELNTPLHYLTLHVWMIGAGRSEFAIRLVSVFAGVVTVALAIHLVGAEQVRRNPMSNISSRFVVALLMAVWPVSVSLSRETRMYSLAVCLCVLSVVLLLRAMRQPRPVWWWAWAAVNVAAFGTHILCVFATAAQALVVALWWHRQRREMRANLLPFAATGVTGAVITFWGVFLLGYGAQYGSTFTDPLNYWVMLQKGILSLFVPRLPPDNQVDLPATLAMIAVFVALLFNPWRARLVMLIGILAVGGIIALVSVTGKFAPRYPEIVAPLIVAGLAFAGLPSVPRALAGTMAFVLASAGLIAVRSEPTNTNDDFRGAAAYLRANAKPDDVVLLVSGHFAPVFAYYYGDTGWAALPADPVLDIRNTLYYDNVAPALNTVLTGKRGAWLLLWQDLIIDPSGIVQTLLIHQAGGADFDSRDFRGLRLLHYGFDPYRPVPDTIAPEHLNSRVDATGAERGISALGCEPMQPVSAGAASAEIACHWLLVPPPPRNILPFDVSVSLTLRDEAGAEYAQHAQLLAPINGMPARWGDQPLTAIYRVPLPADLEPGQYVVVAQPALGGEQLSPRVETPVDVGSGQTQ